MKYAKIDQTIFVLKNVQKSLDIFAIICYNYSIRRCQNAASGALKRQIVCK